MEGNLKWWLTSHFLTKQFAKMDIEWMGERGHMEPEWLHFQVMLPLYFPTTPLKSLQLYGGNVRQLIVAMVKRHGCDACMTWGGRQPSQTDSCGSSTKKIHYRGGRTPAWSICAYCTCSTFAWPRSWLFRNHIGTLAALILRSIAVSLGRHDVLKCTITDQLELWVSS